MATLTMDLSGLKGLTSPLGQNILQKYAGTSGMMAEGVYNPMMRYGYLSPATATLTDVPPDNAFAAPIRSTIYDPVNDDLYFAEMGSQLYRGDTTGDTSITRVVTLSTIITDLEIYQVNGVRKMFVMYKNGSSKAEIAISSLPYDSATDDPTWLTSTTSGAFTNSLSGDFFMLSSENGFGYLFMENQVHKVDGNTTGGSNGTVTPNALLFPVTFRLVDAIDYRGYTFIAFHQYNNDTRNYNPSLPNTGILGVGVYIWNRQTTVAGNNDYTPIPGAIEISKLYIAPNGNIRAICRMSDGYAMMFEYNGSAFAVVRQLGYSGFPFFRDSLDVMGSMTIWNGRDGNLYAYGSVMPGDPEGLFKLFTQTVSSLNAGAILLGAGDISGAPCAYIGWTVNGTNATMLGRLPLFNGVGQTGSQLCASGDVSSLVSYFPPMSTVNGITIYGAPTGTGSTVIGTVTITFNSSSTPWAVKSVTRDQMARGYVHFPVAKEYVNSIQIKVNWPTDLQLGGGSNGDFAPSIALVDYTLTTTKP